MLMWEKEYLKILKKAATLFYLLLFLVIFFLFYRFYLSNFLFDFQISKSNKENLYSKKEAEKIITDFDLSIFQKDKFRYLKERSYQKVETTFSGRENPFVPIQ